MAQIVITITDAANGREVVNAVRRAFAPDADLKVGTKTVIKGVKVRVREAAKSQPNLLHIRAWAAKQGIVLGKRGRIPAAVLASYAATHKA